MITQARCEASGRVLRMLALKLGERLRQRPGVAQTRNGAA
jgi:hypothetical protein